MVKSLDMGDLIVKQVEDFQIRAYSQRLDSFKFLSIQLQMGELTQLLFLLDVT